MKTKLLFTAALMAATVGTQAVPNTGSSMLVQLLESQRLENNVEVLAEGEETSVNDEVSLPTPLAFYDFEEESDAVELKKDGNGTAPYSVPMSETEKGLNFVTADNANMGYVQISNPFKENSNIGTQGATISLWVYFNSLNGRSVWGFGQGASGYENYPKLSLGADSYIVYNMGANNTWIDFNRGGANPFSAGEMTMITMAFNTGSYSLYLNGGAVTYNTTGNGPAGLANLLAGLLTNMKDFPYFYLGKGGFDGTFDGKADKLGFYDKALTADEVKALYDSQKDAYANPIDLNAKEDVTSLITNADFSNADNVTEGWETAMSINSELSATAGLIVHDNGGDRWTGDFYQVIENVPAGIYTLSAQIATRADWAIDLYANDRFTGVGQKNSNAGSPDVVYTTWTDQNINRYSVANVAVTDGTLRIGVRKTNQRAGWLCFDNFRLEKVSLNDILVLYANVKADAQAIDQSLLPEELKTRLNTAMTEPAEYTSDAYCSAYFTLQPVVDLCNAYISECPIETLIETCEAYSQNSVSTSATKATFDTAIAAAEAVDLSTVDINGLREAYNALEAARQAFVQNAVPNGGEGFDVTFQYMKNPNFDGGNADNWSGNMPKQIVNGVPEFWNSKFDFNQTLTNLPNGKYKIEVQARHFGTEGRLYAKTSAEAMAVEQVIIANTVSGTALGNGNLGNEATDMKKERESGSDASRISVEIDVTDGNLIIGMAANAEGSWIVFDDFHLIQLEVSAANLTLNEAGAYSVTTNTYANVTLTRTLKSDGKWNTFCVPFDMTAEQLEANGITDVRTLESANVEGKSVTLNFSESNLNAVEAGVPYLVKVDASYDGTINVENVLVSAAEPTTVSVEGGVSMTGNYAAGNVPTGAYFISDNAFYYADVETVVLKGFRAYINVNGTSEAAGANRLMINLDGEVTGIEDVLGEEAAEADKLVNVVSLDGMTVKAGVKKAEALDGLQKGIYIVDGKKYVVK